MSTSALKPCPFCGGTALKTYQRGDSFAWVLCLNDDCEAEGPPKPTEAEAAEAWNNRPTAG